MSALPCMHGEHSGPRDPIWQRSRRSCPWGAAPVHSAAMPDTINAIAEIARTALAAIEAAADEAALAARRRSVLGRTGSLPQVLRGLGGLSPDERRSVGERANALKATREAALATRGEALRAAARAAVSADALDVTLPARPLRSPWRPR